ncbi:hypothetical protein [Anabaena catenula]|uniref:Uncharacterized protein n=1 Tax=Anabaena catenula FACHB-362 TaxID=2692877 RepID=A0ABR8J4N6_9NOST|nr:hypothetical protein [Anabaena catenula]MBD2692568.1 hypothetical protein [Anabaena catenula FACHB-362]
MTPLNNQVISDLEKEAIAETVHETLSEFRDELKKIVKLGNAVYTDILEGSCFYYAALGADVCTKVLEMKCDDRVYALQAGGFKIMTDPLSFFEYKGDGFDQNNYHCWIAGPLPRKDDGKFEIIDFTVRHYKAQVNKTPNLSWKREDLEGINFIWDYPDNLHNEKGIEFFSNDSITKSMYFQWQDDPDRKMILEKSEEILNRKLANLENQA